MLKPHDVRALMGLLLLPGVLVACATEVQTPMDRPDAPEGWYDDDDEVQDSGVEDQEEPFVVSGTWVTVDEYLPNDGCQMADWVSDGPGGEIELVQDGPDKFTITHDRGDEYCTFNADKSFQCEPYQRDDSTPQDYSLDAVLDMTLTSSGLLPSPEQLIWDTAIQVECVGDGCWAVELATSSFPCDMTVHVEAQPR